MAKLVTIQCTDEHLNIGDVVHIKVAPTGFFTPPKYTITYEFGSHSGTIAENSTDTTFTFRTPHTFYAEIPDAKYGVLTLYCDVYENGVLLSTPYTTVQINAVESISKPTISLPNVRAYDELSPYLTGNDKALIRYVSTALVRATVETHTYATLDYTLIKNGDGTAVWDNEGEFYEVGTNVFTVKAVDSRGFETSIKYTVPAELFVEYIKLTCHIDNTRPNTDGDMRLTCSGNYFNDTFGAVHNSLAVEYRYKEENGEFTAWSPMTASADESTYNAFADLSGLDYRNTYIFECRATDEVTTVKSAEYATYTHPIFHWSKDDFVFETPVDFRAGIRHNGVESDYIVDQGESGAWHYRKWYSGLAECWGLFNKSVSKSDWDEWSGLYECEILTAYAYPFTFVEQQKEYATLHGSVAGMLDGIAWGMSTSTTGSYWAVRPNALDGSYGYNLELYVVGRWK